MKTLPPVPSVIRRCLGMMTVLLMLDGCATTVVSVSTDHIRAEMTAVIREINLNREAMNGLGKRRIGATGFFYIVNSDGIVVFHPRPALIGTSFRNHWFINKIMEEKTGCLTYRLGNRTHVVFYERLTEEEILCFSIVSDDLGAPPAECGPADIR